MAHDLCDNAIEGLKQLLSGINTSGNDITNRTHRRTIDIENLSKLMLGFAIQWYASPTSSLKKVYPNESKSNETPNVD
ncbi:hypothetical protein Tco_0999908, partial [Tanacetum coccineum]